MYKKISNQSPKKAGTFGNIPATFLKESSEICNIVRKNAWNYEYWEHNTSLIIYNSSI